MSCCGDRRAERDMTCLMFLARARSFARVFARYMRFAVHVARYNVRLLPETDEDVFSFTITVDYCGVGPLCPPPPAVPVADGGVGRGTPPGRP